MSRLHVAYHAYSYLSAYTIHSHRARRTYRQTLVVVPWPPSLQASDQAGAPECPCISNSSAIYEQLRTVLVAGGFPPDYGATGCRAYAAGTSLDGCSGEDAPAHCSNPWCYVDMSVCPVNEDLCHAAGAALGSDISPYCRTRPRDYTILLNMSVYYSYETCGSVNLYDPTRHSKELGGNILRAVVAPYPPWVTQRNSSTGNVEYGGPSYDFFQSVLNLFDPPAQLNLLPGWATEQSLQRFRSSYTACVHDVAVGNFDICIADLWLTPNRHRLAWFLPTIRQDLFYLVVPRKFDEVTLLSYLQRPFLPFTPDAWLGVFAFLCGLSAVLWIVRLCETPAKERQGCQWSLQELGNFLFNTWHDFLLGQSSHEVERGLAHKLFSLAFSFFILVTLASYTASLASMLVVQREASGEINSIDDAITAGVPICAPAVLTPTFSTLFGAATFVDCDAIANCARILHAGRCRAMIVSEDIISSLHAGLIQQADCDDVNAGRVSEEVGRCTTTETNPGNARNDCELLRVGDLLWSVPLSFPISDRLAHGMSWAVTQAITAGLFERAKDSELNKEAFPLSQCTVVEDRSEEDGLTLADLTGTIVISMFMVGFGLVCFTLQVLRRDGRELVRRSRTFGQTPAEPEVLEEVRTLTGPEKSLETATPDAATIPGVSWEKDSQDPDQESQDPAPDPVPIQEPRESRAQTSPLAEQSEYCKRI
ncbi:GLR3.4 [Symbiodinium sp. CCMP2592]|nr:GLR3.4 [Symbiodinium sp. CCMP2592]